MKKEDTTTDGDVRVLRSASCPSLSGKSKLGYEIGCGPEGDIQLRVSKNTGSGYFSKGWISWGRVQRVLDKNGAKPITMHTFGPLFKGQSINTAGFLLAVLRSEGLVQVMADKPRCHERLDPGAFLLDIQGLMGSPVASRKKKPAAAKKAASKARKAMT